MEYIIIDIGAPRGNYRRLAVVAWNGEGERPRTIRSTNNVEVVRAWDSLSVGNTKYRSYERALKEAHALRDELEEIDYERDLDEYLDEADRQPSRNT